MASPQHGSADLVPAGVASPVPVGKFAFSLADFRIRPKDTRVQVGQVHRVVLVDEGAAQEARDAGETFEETPAVHVVADHAFRFFVLQRGGPEAHGHGALPGGEGGVAQGGEGGYVVVVVFVGQYDVIGEIVPEVAFLVDLLEALRLGEKRTVRVRISDADTEEFARLLPRAV